MEKIYETKFNIIYFDSEKELLKMVRYDATRDMSEHDYKTDMLKLKDLVIEKNAKYALIDNRELHFVLSPDVQDWANKEVVAPAFQHFLGKVAFIEGANLFANISSQQAIEDNEEKQAHFRFFDNEEEAMKWLLAF